MLTKLPSKLQNLSNNRIRLRDVEGPAMPGPFHMYRQIVADRARVSVGRETTNLHVDRLGCGIDLLLSLLFLASLAMMMDVAP